MPQKPIVIPVGEWLPDMPDYGNPGSNNIRNVYPRTPTSYGPAPSPSVYSSALDNRCQGAAAFIAEDGNIWLFAGTVDKLYVLTAGSTTWADVSKVGGYTTPTDLQWKFEYYNGYVTATNYADAIQVYQLGVSTTFDDLSTDAPTAKYMAFVRGFLMVANTSDGTSGAQPQRVWWPAIIDPTNWPTPGTVTAAEFQSSYDDLFGSQGDIHGLVGNLGNADAAIFFEHAVWRATYSGPPEVFDFFPAEGVRGCPAPNSIVQYGNLVYYLGEDGFYVFDGMSSEPIGANKFDKTFYADLDQGYLDRVIGAVDPLNKQILWAYPGQGNDAGTPNHILVYNWQLQRGTILDVECEMLIRMLTIGYTLDELYTVLGYSLDTLPAPLDSPIWQGGNTLLGMFDKSHRLNFFTGQNLAPLVETTELQPFQGRKARVQNARPLVDGGEPSVAIGRRDRLVDAVNYTSDIDMNSLGTCPVRTSGRYLRGRIELPANSTFTNIQGIELEATIAGIR